MIHNVRKLTMGQMVNFQVTGDVWSSSEVIYIWSVLWEKNIRSTLPKVNYAYSIGGDKN